MNRLEHQVRVPAMDLLLADRLLVRPKQRDGEAYGGHWLRLAHANGLKKARWLLDPAATRAQAMVRVCPLCLRVADAFWRNEWLDGQRAWCKLHSVWLIDGCESCGRKLRWSHVGFDRCGCGSDLREMAARPLSRAVRSAIGEAPATILLWLGALSKYGPVGKPMKRASRRTLVEVIELIERGTDLVVNWPDAFFSTLDAHRLRAGDESAGSLHLLNEALPGLKRTIGKLRDRTWMSAVDAALCDYVAASLQTSTPLVGRNAPGSRPRSVTEMARELGVRPERLSAVLDTMPDVGVTKRHTAGGRCRRVASSAAVAAAKKMLSAEITTKQAARMLGVTAARVYQLIADRKLQKRSGKLDHNAVVELHKSFTRLAVTNQTPVDPVKFEHALRCWIPLDRTGSLIDALQSGELTVYGERSADRTQTLTLTLSLCQVRGWLAVKPAADRGWLTIPEVAERLDLKQEVVYHLVRVGLIATETMRAARRATRVVSTPALHNFDMQFETLARAAARAGIDHRRGLEWAKASGIALVSGPQIDGCRQYFVDLAGSNKTGSLQETGALDD